MKFAFRHSCKMQPFLILESESVEVEDGDILSVQQGNSEIGVDIDVVVISLFRKPKHIFRIYEGRTIRVMFKEIDATYRRILDHSGNAVEIEWKDYEIKENT